MAHIDFLKMKENNYNHTCMSFHQKEIFHNKKYSCLKLGHYKFSKDHCNCKLLCELV